MSIPEATSEPVEITAGDSLRWSRSLPDFPAGSGWQLNYRLRGPANIDLAWGTVVSADGDAFDVEIPAATTAAWAAGDYWLFGWVTDGTDRVTIYDAQVAILANPATASGTYDGRTHTQVVLDAIEAMIEGTASREEESVAVNFGGTVRQLSFFSREDLLKLYSYYQRQRQAEIAKEDALAGRGNRNVRRYRFTKPS